MSESLVTNDQIITNDQTMQMIVGTATAKSNMSFFFWFCDQVCVRQSLNPFVERIPFM